MPNTIRGKAYVVGDNIDTDQIIPAQYLNLVPTIPEEYQKLGSYALAGLPESSYPTRFVKEGATKTEYQIIMAGKNCGCGSSREHAPIALGASGAKAVIAESYARIFFRNCVATGELYPVESYERLIDKIKTGDEVSLDLEKNELTHLSSKRVFSLKPLGEAAPVIDAGGIFNYARKHGMISSTTDQTVQTAALSPEDD